MAIRFASVAMLLNMQSIPEEDIWAEFYNSVDGLQTNHSQLLQFGGLHFYAHRFRFPEPLADTLLCVPQKNGNRYFGALFYMLHFRKPPLDAKELLQGMKHFDFSVASESDRVWVIARNPYTRLLSYYLHAVVSKCIAGSLQCNRREGNGDDQINMGNHMGYNPQKPPSFAAWVEMLAELLAKSLPHGVELCSINKHFCSQFSGCGFRDVKELKVLKLERQAEWFSALVALAGLKVNDLLGMEWEPFTGKPCFYTPTGNCSDMLQHKATGRFTDNLHATGAGLLVSEYYTPRAAELVRFMYSLDFVVLGYSSSIAEA